MSNIEGISAVKLGESLGVNRKNIISLARKYFSKTELNEIEITQKSL
jgi:hypothetical protein